MKLFLPLMALAIVGAAPLEEQNVEGELTAPLTHDESVQTPVVDPDADYACEDDPVLADGAEGDARLFRDPAQPETLQPIRAVDYEVDGCGLLVMADGSLMHPPRQDEERPATYRPAQ